MSLPFTKEQFFDVFRLYNESVWPAQIGLFLVALLGVVLLFVRWPRRGRVLYGLLATLWVWMATAYHLSFFWRINPAAPLFAVLFVVTGGVFLWHALGGAPPAMDRPGPWRAAIGGVLLLYSLLLYPLLGWVFGHVYPAAPGFGLPCPTTIYTIGILTFVLPRPARIVLAGPIVWAAIGSVAAFALGVYQDYGLLVAGLWAAALGSGGADHASFRGEPQA